MILTAARGNAASGYIIHINISTQFILIECFTITTNTKKSREENHRLKMKFYCDDLNTNIQLRNDLLFGLAKS